MEFSRQKYWSGLPFPSAGDLPHQGSNLGLAHCRETLYQLSHLGAWSIWFSLTIIFWCSDYLPLCCKLLYSLTLHPHLLVAVLSGLLEMLSPSLDILKFLPNETWLSTFRLWLSFKLTLKTKSLESYVWSLIKEEAHESGRNSCMLSNRLSQEVKGLRLSPFSQAEMRISGSLGNWNFSDERGNFSSSWVRNTRK